MYCFYQQCCYQQGLCIVAINKGYILLLSTWAMYCCYQQGPCIVAIVDMLLFHVVYYNWLCLNLANYNYTTATTIITVKAKIYIFKNKQLLDCSIKNETKQKRKLSPCRPQPGRLPLPFNIIYNNIVALWLHRHSMILKPVQY